MKRTTKRVLKEWGPVLLLGLLGGLTAVVFFVPKSRAAPACLSDRPAALRSAYVTVAIERGCATFPKGRIDDLVANVGTRLSTRDAGCAYEIAAVLAEAAGRAKVPGFCREAERQRNYGIGAAGQDSVETVIVKAKDALRPGETVIGAWLDERHPCGLVVITQDKGRVDSFLGCSSGGTTRALPDNDRPLASVTAPSGARRAWESPGLKRSKIKVLGVETIEFKDKYGGRHDFRRFVELSDGTLLGYEEGVGSEPGEKAKPWMEGRPVDIR